MVLHALRSSLGQRLVSEGVSELKNVRQTGSVLGSREVTITLAKVRSSFKEHCCYNSSVCDTYMQPCTVQHTQHTPPPHTHTPHTPPTHHTHTPHTPPHTPHTHHTLPPTYHTRTHHTLPPTHHTHTHRRTVAKMRSKSNKKSTEQRERK